MTRHHVDLKRELEELKKKAEGVFKSERRIFDARASAAVRLMDAIGGEEVQFGEGAFHRVLVDASAVWSEAEAFHREYLEALGSPFFPAAAGFGTLKALRDVRPERVCYLDIETTGLSMAPLFLVGLMYASEGRLVVDQLFARDYSEEAAVLAYLASLMPRFEAIVTFNGITFDVPYIEERMTIHRLSFPAPATHVDLLPLARSVVGGKTPNHRLQTLEAHFCNRKRVGDIAGADIPASYHEFVRTHDAKDMANIIHHNRLDLVTMLQLVTVFLSREIE
jgi:uncharacterized protein YprB with RNaseH-like and TPR domain